jgi:short-subunit dehydrogenase
MSSGGYARMSSLRPVAVITGASAGIGVALARVFARHGHELALVARREDRLNALADEIAASGARRPIVIVADLLKPGAARQIADALTGQGAEPQFVVNNAGFGLVGLAASLDHDEQLQMVDLNVRALTELSLAFIDSLARNNGGLLNVGSMAGFLPGPGMAVYYATKAYVLSFTEALHNELKPRGVRVAVLCPGPVPTEFAARAGVSGGTLAPSVLTQSADDVAEAGYRGLMGGHRTIVQGFLNKLITVLIRLTPRSLILHAAEARQARRRPARQT